MATIIVSSSVWNRIYEYYENVETKYSNTWDINDTIEQINKIQWVISNFESVCAWSREPIILYWKRMGWKETWHRSSPWHFAFECKRVDEQNYIFIQDAEHQDDIKESCFNTKGKIIENKQYNTMKNKRNKVRLTESQLHTVVKESVKRVLKEVALGGETFHGNNPEDWSALADLQTARGWRRGEEGDFRGRENDFTRASSNRRKAEQMPPPMDMSEFDQYIGDDGAYHFPDEETRNKKWSREIAHNLPLRRGSMKGRSVGKKIGLGDYMD